MADESTIEKATGVYRRFATIPRISSGNLRKRSDGMICVESIWSARSLECNKKRKLCRKFYITQDKEGLEKRCEDDFPSELSMQVSAESPSGKLKAILRKSLKDKKKEETQYIEIWSKRECIKNYDISTFDKHGMIYDDKQFGCFVWSPCEKYILYVAEKKSPKTSSYFETKKDASPEEKLGKGKQYVYEENWGELLSTCCEPVLAYLDIQNDEIKVVEGIPETLSPGQAVWVPNSTGIIFTGWSHVPYRLGLIYCTNRKSGIYYVSVKEGTCELLSNENDAVHSPRLSPSGNKLVYFARISDGPHKCCLKVMMYDWKYKTTTVLLDVVDKPENVEAFPGFYDAGTPLRVWSQDESIVVLNTFWRSSKYIIAINADSSKMRRLHPFGNGCWTLLDVKDDLVLVSFSSPNISDQLMVAPLFGQKEESLSWQIIDDGTFVDDIHWEIINITPEKTTQGSWQDYQGLLITPKKKATKLPLIVFPHGGPHSLVVADFLLYPVVFASLGYAVLLVNYRGSLGFGQSSLLSLPGNIGNQDVKDVQFAAEQIMQRDDIDQDNVFVTGGSHGGFLTAHLIGQYPKFYKASAMMNPVINLTSMLAATDIPDWCMFEGGDHFSFQTLPTAEILSKLLDKSPIIFADKVETPTLILLGAVDLRVPSIQGKEFYKALKSCGTEVSLLWYPEDSHPLDKVATEADVFMNILTWFDTHKTS